MSEVWTFDHCELLKDCRKAVARRNQMKRVKKISLADIAAETGISKGFLSVISHGGNLSMDTFITICRALDLNPCDYFELDAIATEDETRR